MSELAQIQEKASRGDVIAQKSLAHAYVIGDFGLKSDQVEAFHWYMEAAGKGDIEAEIEVAKRLDEGIGSEQDYKAADIWWGRAADAGNAAAQFHRAGNFGLTYRSTSIFGASEDEIQKNAREYIAWLRKSADQGFAEAQFSLGLTELLGAQPLTGVKTQLLIAQDHGEGTRLLDQSAAQGYWHAQWALGVLYQAGYAEIKIDPALSHYYWEQLKKQTDPSIQAEIAALYNETDASSYRIGQNKYDGKALDFQETNAVAYNWYSKAAAQGSAIALYQLGLLSGQGRGIAQDSAAAAEFLRKSASLGNYDAMAELGFCFYNGEGVVKDYESAFKWLEKASISRPDSVILSMTQVPKSRNALGVLYEYGYGVDKDLVLAYAWYNVAASNGYPQSKKNLARVEQQLDANSLREAQSISSNWRPGFSMARANSVPADGKGTIQTNAADTGRAVARFAVGSGFFVTSDGGLLTNNHVVEGCAEMRIPAQGTKATLVVTDPSNDLALLKVAPGENVRPLRLGPAEGIRQGENIFVFGFPLDGFLPASGNITTGIVAALSGPANNASLMQITAPVQLGNSGGPLLDEKARVVGVVVGKADSIKLAKVTGDLPQNVNYVVSLPTVRSFLDANNVPYDTNEGWLSVRKTSVDIAEVARASTVKVECWK